MRHSVLMWGLLLSAAVATTACSKPKLPDDNDMPEPQAAAHASKSTSSSATAAQPSQLREAMQQPIDKVEAAQAATAAAENARDDALNAATNQ